MEKRPQESASREADKYIVRFPDGMRELIAKAAEANGRSMNAEIVMRLISTFEAGGEVSDAKHNVADLVAKRDAALSTLTLVHSLYRNLAGTVHDMCARVEPVDEVGAGMLAVVEHMTREASMGSEKNFDVIAIMDEAAERFMQSKAQPDNPSPKLKSKRMTMRRKLKD